MFSSINWSDTAIVSALITGTAGVLASTIAAVVGYTVGKRFLNQKAIQDRLQTAIEDIQFLLACEDEHCRDGDRVVLSTKLGVRNLVREQGLKWSGKFTPGRARAYVADLPVIRSANNRRTEPIVVKTFRSEKANATVNVVKDKEEFALQCDTRAVPGETYADTGAAITAARQFVMHLDMISAEETEIANINGNPRKERSAA